MTDEEKTLLVTIARVLATHLVDTARRDGVSIGLRDDMRRLTKAMAPFTKDKTPE